MLCLKINLIPNLVFRKTTLKLEVYGLLVVTSEIPKSRACVIDKRSSILKVWFRYSRYAKYSRTHMRRNMPSNGKKLTEYNRSIALSSAGHFPFQIHIVCGSQLECSLSELKYCVWCKLYNNVISFTNVIFDNRIALCVLCNIILINVLEMTNTKLSLDYR